MKVFQTLDGKSFKVCYSGLVINRLVLTSGTLAGTDVSGRDVYRATILANLQPIARVTNEIGGLSDFSNRVAGSVFLTVNAANQIVACGAENPADISLAADFCRGFGGTYNAETKKCDSLVDLTQVENARDICSVTGQTFNASTGKCNPVATTVAVASGAQGGPPNQGGSSTGVSTGTSTGRWVFISQAGTCSTGFRYNDNSLIYKDISGQDCSPKGILKTVTRTTVMSLTCTFTYQCQ